MFHPIINQHLAITLFVYPFKQSFGVAVYDLGICIKEDNPGSNYFKGDN